jgi:hypothetical protein
MRAYARENPLGENFLWCADIQEGVEDLLYVDQMHYAPNLSRLLARCIADGIRGSGAAASELPAIRDVDGDGAARIACIGDSNTMSSWQRTAPGGFEREEGWCEQLGRLFAPRPGWKTVNVGLGGARAAGTRRSTRAGAGTPSSPTRATSSRRTP